MKKARLINAAIWVALGAGIILLVCSEWYRMGCGKNSLIAASLIYGLFSASFCGIIDEQIKEHYKNR